MKINTIYYIFIVILLIVSFRLSTKEYCPEGKYNYKGYGEKKEKISILIDRIDWANNYNGRVCLFYRFIFYSIIITFVSSLILQNKLPSPLVYTQCILVVLITLKALNHYTEHHCDKFSNYAIDRNINIIREKLKLPKNDNLSHINYKFLGNSECWNFTYKET